MKAAVSGSNTAKTAPGRIIPIHRNPDEDVVRLNRAILVSLGIGAPAKMEQDEES